MVEKIVITPDYCRGILEAEALFRVLVTAFSATLVTTLGLSARVLILRFGLTVGSCETGQCKHLARFLTGRGVDEKCGKDAGNFLYEKCPSDI